MNKTIIGIDPGANGAICKVGYGKNNKIMIHKCPKEIEDRTFVCSDGLRDDVETVAYIEKVHAMPHDGRSSLFKFGVNYGVWLGILHTNPNVGRIIEVSPQKWMKFWENRLGEKLPRVKKDRKNKLKEMASVFTDKPARLWDADAVLITMYGFYMEEIRECNV